MSIPATATTTEGTLAEVDKSRQLLFLVQDGITTYVMNASTGDDRSYEEPDGNTPGVMIKGTAVTPVGSFKINRERPDGWWIGDLGQIYRPKYFWKAITACVVVSSNLPFGFASQKPSSSNFICDA
jgi:hypothetical protein